MVKSHVFYAVCLTFLQSQRRSFRCPLPPLPGFVIFIFSFISLCRFLIPPHGSFPCMVRLFSHWVLVLHRGFDAPIGFSLFNSPLLSTSSCFSFIFLRTGICSSHSFASTNIVTGAEYSHGGRVTALDSPKKTLLSITF